MSEPHERLREARIAAGYETAAAAATAMGIRVPTYTHHENGRNSLSRSGPRYASFFRVSLEWLLTGKGSMRGGCPAEEPKGLSERQTQILSGVLLHIFQRLNVEPAERLVEVVLKSVQAPELVSVDIGPRGSALARVEIALDEVQPRSGRPPSKRLPP
jgi:hypothetical protein